METTSTTNELFGRERRVFSSISYSNTLFKNISKSEKLLIRRGWSKIWSTPLDACQYRKLPSVRLHRINPKLKFILNQRVCLRPKSRFLEKEGHRSCKNKDISHTALLRKTFHTLPAMISHASKTLKRVCFIIPSKRFLMCSVFFGGPFKLIQTLSLAGVSFSASLNCFKVSSVVNSKPLSISRSTTALDWIDSVYLSCLFWKRFRFFF